MLMSYNIYWDDLKEEVKAMWIEDGFHPHENLDCMPLAIINIESDAMYDEEDEEIEE